jgi:hypothetical protein
MGAMPAKQVFAAVLILLLLPSSLYAQASAATLSGTVTDPSGKPVADAKVSVKNVASGQSYDALTDPDGHYSVSNLAAGDYEVTASAEGIGAASAKVTLTAGSQQTQALALTQQPSTAPPLRESSQRALRRPD